jgi:hypothetical protein
MGSGGHGRWVCVRGRSSLGVPPADRDGITHLHLPLLPGARASVPVLPEGRRAWPRPQGGMSPNCGSHSCAATKSDRSRPAHFPQPGPPNWRVGGAGARSRPQGVGGAPRDARRGMVGRRPYLRSRLDGSCQGPARWANRPGGSTGLPDPGTSGSREPRSRDGLKDQVMPGLHHPQHDSQECGDRKRKRERSWSPGRLPVDSTISPQCPRQESNLRTRFRKPLLYPLSYEGRGPRSRAWHGLAETPQKTPPDSTVQRSRRF